MDEHDHTTHGTADVDASIDPLEDEPAGNRNSVPVRTVDTTPSHPCAVPVEPDAPSAGPDASPADQDALPAEPDPPAEPDAVPPDPDAYGETVRLATQLVRGTRLERARLAARELDRSTTQERAANADVAGLDASTGDPATLSQRLHALARAGGADLAEQIRLLVAFDEAGLWKRDGGRTCRARRTGGVRRSRGFCTCRGSAGHRRRTRSGRRQCRGTVRPGDLRVRQRLHRLWRID